MPVAGVNVDKLFLTFFLVIRIRVPSLCSPKYVFLYLGSSVTPTGQLISVLKLYVPIRPHPARKFGMIYKTGSLTDNKIVKRNNCITLTTLGYFYTLTIKYWRSVN